MKSKIALGILCFFVTFVIFFPYETIKERALRDVAKETNVNIVIQRILPTIKGAGLHFKGVSVQYLGKLSPKGLLGVEMSWLKVYVPWMSLVSFSPYLDVAGVIDKKSPLKAKVKKSGAIVDLNMKLLRFAFEPYLEKLGFSGLDIVGRLDADLKAKLNTKKNQLGKTSAKLEIQNFILGNFEAGGFSIPRMEFKSPVKVLCDSKKGKVFKLNISVGSPEDPLTFTSEGQLMLNAKTPQLSEFSLKSVITFSQQMLKQPSIELLLPFLDQFKAEDGSFRVQFTGNLVQGVTQFPTRF